MKVYVPYLLVLFISSCLCNGEQPPVTPEPESKITDIEFVSAECIENTHNALAKFIIDYENPPSTGNLIINKNVEKPILESPQLVSFKPRADGQRIQVSARFSVVEGSLFRKTFDKNYPFCQPSKTQFEVPIPDEDIFVEIDKPREKIGGIKVDVSGRYKVFGKVRLGPPEQLNETAYIIFRKDDDIFYPEDPNDYGVRLFGDYEGERTGIFENQYFGKFELEEGVYTLLLKHVSLVFDDDDIFGNAESVHLLNKLIFVKQ